MIDAKLINNLNAPLEMKRKRQKGEKCDGEENIGGEVAAYIINNNKK